MIHTLELVVTKTSRVTLSESFRVFFNTLLDVTQKSDPVYVDTGVPECTEHVFMCFIPTLKGPKTTKMGMSPLIFDERSIRFDSIPIESNRMPNLHEP